MEMMSQEFAKLDSLSRGLGWSALFVFTGIAAYYFYRLNRSTQTHAAIMTAEELADTAEDALDEGQLDVALEKTLAAIKRLGRNFRTISLHNNAAWIYATAPDGNLRNAELAMRHIVAALSWGREADASATVDDLAVLKLKEGQAHLPDTLAAVYADRGEFDKAAKLMREVLALSDTPSRRARLELYEQGKPYRHAAGEGPVTQSGGLGEGRP